ncbi:cytochrome ubiquinol oxidase subunit I [Catellatospora bangladeshensis]|uniref:Cytochrome ubiquinol oxidase subunit I n=1 Tax=Catellatospora bangladeshensis TaxID=310355 RepID=A0A8J3JEH6_9ACTN|nr:cytochrome ubiquinol oxidase subunit I [Catellatospora bangladeshensis]GIF82986.1 cytochrome ubiquinol oxidase subunit I [Catellatospora bangladeshensis]
MDAIELARWQFGITTVYHFLFVPLTIGLVWLVAAFQTAWVRTGDEKWLKLTKFFGKLFLINFAMGLVTGIVQEFQFGMNWSEYSRFVGDVFGAPLAMEALVAFFLESTFLGLWIFGWEKLPKKIHLACIWIVAVGTVLSAYFILAANSWMQNPVGYRIDQATGRAELTDIVAVLTNKVALITVPHTIAGCFLVAGGLVAAVAVWHLVRRAGTDTAAFRSAAKIGAWTTLVAMGAMLLTGDIQGKIMTEVQPMKMAAAEALYESEQPAPFSVFTVGTLDGSRPVWSVEIPGLLSFLGTGSFDGRVEGINDLQHEYEQKYGPGEYKPNIPLTYWTFRLMIGLGAAAALLALWILWATRRGRTPTSRWLVRSLPLLPLLPLVANSTGWIFTEMGRQPWVVFGEMKTAAANSPNVSVGYLVTSLAVFTLLYGVLAVIEVRLLLKYARAGLPDVSPPVEKEAESDEDRPLAFAY